MKEYMKLIRIKYNNKIFDIFSDSKHHKTFLEVKKIDNKEKYYYPELKDLVNLNMIYNLNDDNLYIKKYKFKEKLIISSLAVSLSIEGIALSYSIKEQSILNNSYLSEDLIIEDDNNNYLVSNKKIFIKNNTALDELGMKTKTFTDVRNTLSNNKNLDAQDLKYINLFINRLEERLPDVDLRIFNRNLKKLKIIKVPNDLWKRENNVAYYTAYKDTITIKEKYSNEEELMEVYFHELGHTLNSSEFELKVYDEEDEKNKKYHIYKRYYEYDDENQHGKDLTEGMNTILTDYLMCDNYEYYFLYEHHNYSAYRYAADTCFQLLKLYDDYDLYDYLNGHVEDLEVKLNEDGFEQLIDTISVITRSEESNISRKIKYEKCNEQILKERVKKMKDEGKTILEIYESLDKNYSCYGKELTIGSEVLSNYDWDILIENQIPDKNYENEHNSLVKMYTKNGKVINKNINNVFIYNKYDDNNNINYNLGYYNVDNEKNIKYFDLETKEELKGNNNFYPLEYLISDITDISTERYGGINIKINSKIFNNQEVIYYLNKVMEPPKEVKTR